MLVINEKYEWNEIVGFFKDSKKFDIELCQIWSGLNQLILYDNIREFII